MVFKIHTCYMSFQEYLIIVLALKLSKQEWYSSELGARPSRSIWKIWIITWGSRKSTSCISRIRIEYEAFKAGYSERRRNRGVCARGRKREAKETRKEGQKARARERGRDAEEGENGFTRQSLSGRPRENHNARPPSSRRPSSSFCPPVRSSVCLPVHPFVSSSASCHSPRQPSDGSRIRNSSPLLSSSGFSFCSFPAAAAAGLLLCTVLLPERC